MLKIEVIKFEAQDVITASGVAGHKHSSETVPASHNHPVNGYHEGARACKDCGELVWCPLQDL